MEKSPGKIAVYSRKSRFTGKGASVENQVELCCRYIKEHYRDIAESDILIYEDEGFSGSHTQRPEFRRMMEDAAQKKFSAIVCYRLDRISRNIGDFAKLIEKLESLGISFISIKEQFDTRSPMGRAMMYIASVFSQLERETIAERIRDNMLELAKSGCWLGGVSPTGYRSEAIEKTSLDGRKRKTYRLVQIPEEEKLVRLIFDSFLQFKSLSKTETFLLQNGIKTRKGKYFSRFAIKNILRNPVYMIADEDAYHYLQEKSYEIFSPRSAFDGIHGIMAYNKTLQKRGKSNKIRDPREWIVAVGGHKGFIRGADWVRVQQILDQNKSKSYRKVKNSSSLLSGLLFCGKCGSYMRPKLTPRKDSQGRRVFYYLCELKEKSRRLYCSISNPDGQAADETVLDIIKDIRPDASELVRCLSSGGRVLEHEQDERSGQIKLLKKMQRENTENISRLVTYLGSLGNKPGRDAEKYIIEKIKELHKNNQSITEKIIELEKALLQNSLSPDEICELKKQLLSYSNMIDAMDTEKKRQLLRSIIKKVLWDGESLIIYMA